LVYRAASFAAAPLSTAMVAPASFGFKNALGLKQKKKPGEFAGHLTESV
jgi:hypothetical protein